MRPGSFALCGRDLGVSPGCIGYTGGYLPAPVRGYVQFAAEARSYLGYAQVRT